MSTKTTFKRVALVTVAALGLGVMSVAASNAAVQADTMVTMKIYTQVLDDEIDKTGAILARIS